MKDYNFKKGIHPPYRKDATREKLIEVLVPKGDMVYSMCQHIGAPCTPIVKKGDRVLVGQKIGEIQGYLGAPIHSTVSGTVKNVEDHLVSKGNKVKSVIVENDGLYEEDPSINQEYDYTTMSNEEIIEVIKEAGIVGMGGAGFPTFIKLSPPPEKEIKHIFINGAECEPYLTSDHRIMLEEPERLVGGLKILLHLFPGAKGYIGIEDNKPDAIEIMKKHTQGEANIGVYTLPTKYPQGSEKHMIYSILKKEVPSGCLPMDIGCIVHNIDTTVAIWRALTRGRPLMRRIVTVSGDGVNNPCNIKARIGTSYRELLEYAGWNPDKIEKIISGGPMMGTALNSVDVPVEKGTSAILAFTKKVAITPPESNCIRCNKCVEACPCLLMPLVLNQDSLARDTDAFVEHGGLECMECGSCSYICPAKRHLVQSIRTAKADVRKQQQDQK